MFRLDKFEFKTLEELLGWLREIKVDLDHDTELTTHEYEESETWPGTCAVCGWVKADTPAPTGCGHTLRQHVERMVLTLEELTEEQAAVLAERINLLMADRLMGEDHISSLITELLDGVFSRWIRRPTTITITYVIRH